MLINEAFRPTSFSDSQAIKVFGKREGVMISDFDSFMPDGNPIFIPNSL